MKYFITGGTGFIGTNIVNLLLDRDHEVVVLTRSAGNAHHLPSEVTVVEGDITNKESMRSAMTGVDGVFHNAAWFFIGPGPKQREHAERINVDGTRNVLELMEELDIPKGVYTSTVGVFGHTGGKTVEETVRPTTPGLNVYFETKWRAHYEVAQPMVEEGLPLVIVHPGGVYGPGDKPYGSVRSAFKSWLEGDLPMISRRFALPFDYVEDTAEAIVRAMERGEPGESYIISSEPHRVADLFAMASEITGVKAPRTVSPVWFRLLSSVMTLVEAVGTPPKGMEPEIFRTYGKMEILVDNSKAREELGIEHRSIEEGLREYLEWEMDADGIEMPAPKAVAT